MDSHPNARAENNGMVETEETSISQGDMGKGKGKEIAHDSAEATGLCRLVSLPPELIDNILSFLSPLDLLPVSATCRLLYSHGTADHMWQKMVQDHVPGIRVNSSYPFESFYELYKAHDPYWFLPKYKIWFSDGDLTGRLVLVRYDQRRGCVEGYQLVAVSRRDNLEPWLENRQVMIHAFEPKVKLHLDKPILHLPAIRGPDDRLPSRFRTEILMDNGSNDNAYSSLMFTRPLDQANLDPRLDQPWPYGNLWPPPVVPARHRTVGSGVIQTPLDIPLVHRDKPTSRRELSDQMFRIRKGLVIGTGIYGASQLLRTDAVPGWHGGDLPNPVSIHLNGSISTYSTLDPKLYTPTPEKPFRGIWVGDYSGHGCEFLLIHQPDDQPESAFDPDSVQRRENESDEQFAKRKHDEMVYRGRLEAIKLTGDPNVPRGEITFVADDLGEAGFVTVVQHEPFTGTRVVKSKGQVAHMGFMDHQYMESQLLLISHDRLAQYWLGFRHISFFERVNIDKFLVPGQE